MTGWPPSGRPRLPGVARASNQSGWLLPNAIGELVENTRPSSLELDRSQLASLPARIQSEEFCPRGLEQRNVPAGRMPVTRGRRDVKPMRTGSQVMGETSSDPHSARVSKDDGEERKRDRPDVRQREHEEKSDHRARHRPVPVELQQPPLHDSGPGRIHREPSEQPHGPPRRHSVDVPPKVLPLKGANHPIRKRTRGPRSNRMPIEFVHLSRVRPEPAAAAFHSAMLTRTLPNLTTSWRDGFLRHGVASMRRYAVEKA